MNHSQSGSDIEDYLNSSYGLPGGSGRGRGDNLRGLGSGSDMQMMNGGGGGAGMGGGGGAAMPRPMPQSPVGLGALQPQKSATQMTSAVRGQVGPNPMQARGTMMGGGLLSPASGNEQGGALMSQAIPASPIRPQPPMQMPIRRPELGMGAVERGPGMGGLGSITPQNTPFA